MSRSGKGGRTMDEEKLNQLSERIIGSAFKVSNVLGCGFLEKVYENALAHELRKSGLNVDQQHPISVYYDEVNVGDFFADLLVEGTILVELKAVAAFSDDHTAQCLNYLTATGRILCLLLTFGRPRVLIKRFR